MKSIARDVPVAGTSTPGVGCPPHGCHLLRRRGHVHVLPRRSQSMQVVAGCAWITVDGHDVIVNQGETKRITARGTAVISALGDQTLVYTVW